MVSRALNSRLLQSALLLVAVSGTWAAPPAIAQGTGTAADQTVDQLELFSSKKLLRLKFDVTPTKVVGLTAAPTSNLRACQSTANNGLICLDGQVVRQWSTTIEHPISTAPTGAAGTPLFSCTDSAFAFKGTTPCTAMTVDTKGGIWVAGLRSNNTYSLMQVVKKNGTVCPAAASSTPAFASLNQNYCFRARATGRPVITDLSPVEGNLVEQYFTEGEGVLGVEAGAAVVYYPYDFTQNRRTYGSWPTTVQSAAIFQRFESTVLQTYVVVAASSGIIYSRVITSGDNGTESKFVHANSNSDPLKLPRGDACSKGGEKQFGVRASETSGRVFITSRNYCRAYVLTPLPNMQGIALPVDSVSTTSTSGKYPPDGLSVAPGIAVNVAQGCTDGVINLGDPGGCPLIEDSVGDTNVYPGLRMYGVELEPGSPTSLRIYKVEGIPDCRYLLQQSLIPVPDACQLPGVVVNDPTLADGTENFPQRQFLNVTPMLPSNVTDVFDASGKKPTGLPAMLIQPRARGQASNSYYFDAIFGVADPNIRFRETFTVEFDVSDPNLAGTNLGCGLHQTPLPQAFTEWDIMTVVSERYSSVGGPFGLTADTLDFLGQTVPAEHVDTMINKDCYNPGPNAGTRWSMYSYNLELAEDTPVRSSPSGPVTGFAYSRPVTYFGNLLLSLHTELGKAQADLACTNVDALGNTGVLAATPLSSATCTTLNNSWATAQSSMTSCAAAAASAPAFSAQTPVPAVCDTFFTQFTAYKSQVEIAASAVKGTGLDKDPANRAGELWSRTDVIKHVFEDHFVKAWSLGLGTP